MPEYAKFTEDMIKTHTILVPDMLPVHFKLFISIFEAEGYHMELLQNDSRAVVDEGLKNVHNDACYPALLVIGQFMDALKSGKYDVDKTALLITQTGGGCRASNYIHLLRKAVAKYNAEYPEKPLPPITPHIFRHTFCSNMLNDGVSLPNTQAMMGHENPNTTLTYAHPDATQAMAEMARINRQREQARASV